MQVGTAAKGKRGLLVRFGRDVRGTTSIEYGLIAMLVAVGMLVGLKALGSGNANSWGDTSNKLTDAMKGN